MTTLAVVDFLMLCKVFVSQGYFIFGYVFLHTMSYVNFENDSASEVVAVYVMNFVLFQFYLV